MRKQAVFPLRDRAEKAFSEIWTRQFPGHPSLRRGYPFAANR
jgi:hypothetical protein